MRRATELQPSDASLARAVREVILLREVKSFIDDIFDRLIDSSDFYPETCDSSLNSDKAICSGMFFMSFFPKNSSERPFELYFILY